MILGGQSIGKDVDSGINPRILPQGDEAAAYKHTLDMSFFRFTSVYVACQRRRISGRRFSYFRVEKRDDQKYICIRPKTVNVKGYSVLLEPIRTREKLLSTDLVNTKTNYQLGLVMRVAIFFCLARSAHGFL